MGITMRTTLVLSFVVFCFVTLSYAQNGKANSGSQGGSCVGRCGEGATRNNSTCKCNSSCSRFGDCCPDYSATCLSCKGRCGMKHNPKMECQCNSQCSRHGNCCADYNGSCGASRNSTASLSSCKNRCGLKHDPKLPCQCNTQCSRHKNCCSDYNSSCARAPAPVSALPLSCKGKCGLKHDPKLPCQCNTQCSRHNNCCSDYSNSCARAPSPIPALPLSCKGRCGSKHDPKLPCQCNTQCSRHKNCCSDYNGTCGRASTTSTNGGVSNSQLKEFSNKLIRLDENNCALLIEYESQGNTKPCGSDNARRPFFKTFDASIWRKPTIARLRDIFDNYNSLVTAAEDHTPAERAEENAFLDAVMNTTVMNAAYDFLNTKGVFRGSKKDFRAKLYDLWFVGYDRDGNSATNIIGSSGFEHVFLGESKNGKISGFHNWIYWGYEEQAGNLNYFGKLDQIDFGQFGAGISNVFSWSGQKKCVGSMFLGTSPELDLAAYTVCFLTREKRSCHLEYNGKPVRIVTHGHTVKGKTYIATAYPDFG